MSLVASAEETIKLTEAAPKSLPGKEERASHAAPGESGSADSTTGSGGEAAPSGPEKSHPEGVEPATRQEPAIEHLDESLSLGDGDDTSTRFFSSAPPAPAAESLVLEDWAIEQPSPSEEQVRRTARLKRIALVLIGLLAAFAAAVFGLQWVSTEGVSSPSGSVLR